MRVIFTTFSFICTIIYSSSPAKVQGRSAKGNLTLQPKGGGLPTGDILAAQLDLARFLVYFEMVK